MCRLIEKHPSLPQLYSRYLIRQNVISQPEIDVIRNNITLKQEREFEMAQSFQPDPLEWLASDWRGEAVGSLLQKRPYNQTGVAMETLRRLGRSLLKVPEDFVLHKDIDQLLHSRRRMLESGEGVSMAFAEALAFACLMSKYSPEPEIDSNRKLDTLDIQMQVSIKP